MWRMRGDASGRVPNRQCTHRYQISNDKSARLETKSWMLARFWIVTGLPTTHPEPVLTQQYPLKVRVRQPNVQRPATVLGDHPRHQVSLSESQEADHCRKQDTVPEGGTQDFAFLADQTDGRDSDRNVLR
jgi:hypothetical protein